MDEELESEAYEYNDEELGGDTDTETEVGSEETVNESETVESANEETAANETEAVDFGSYTTPLDTSFIKTPAIGEDDEKNGFDPEKYETASELLESNEFKQEKNEAKDAYDKAQSAIDNVENEYKNFVKEKESTTTEGLELPTLEDFTATMQSKLAEAKDAYDKISKDENIFRDYVNKYSSDWDNYNKANPKEKSVDSVESSKLAKAKNAMDTAYAEYQKAKEEFTKKTGMEPTSENINTILNEVQKSIDNNRAFYNMKEDVSKNLVDAIVNRYDGTYKAGGYEIKLEKGAYVIGKGQVMNAEITPPGSSTPVSTFAFTLPMKTPFSTVSADDNITITVLSRGEKNTVTRSEGTIADAFAGAMRDSFPEQFSGVISDMAKYAKEAKDLITKEDAINKATEDYKAAKSAIDISIKKEADAKADAKAKAVAELYNKYKNGEISASEFTELKEEVKAIDMTSDYEKAETMASLKEKIDAFKVDDINETNYEQKQSEIASLEAQLSSIGNETLIDLTKTMMGQGKTIDDIRESEEFKSFSTELFTLAQNIYDKADTIENVMVSMGLDKPGKEAGIIDKTITTVEAAYDAVKNGQPLNANQGYAVLHCMDSIQGVKSAAEALMKSAAFNGASNIKGGKAAEAMKQEVATKLSWKDWASTSAWGTLGILATSVGVVTGNPILIGAGIYVNLKAGGNFAGKVTMSNVTKEQQMFGMGDDRSTIMDKAIEVYNQSQEPANIGDPKSASTYATAGTAVVDALVSMPMLVNPATVINGISHIKESISEFTKITKGGLEGNAKILVNNVYNFAWAIQAMTGENLSIPTMGDVISFIDNISDEGFDNDSNSGYGVAADIDDIDDKYSGYIEKAKNSNIATDYNEGMEKETNEAVSDMRVKIYKVYSSEPDYIRKAIEKILKSYKEQW